MNNLNHCLIIVGNNEVRLRARVGRARQEKVLSRVEVHVVTSECLVCFLTISDASSTGAEEVNNVFPESKRLQPFSPHSVFSSHDLALRARVRNTGLLLADCGDRDEGVGPHDGYVAASGTLQSLFVSGEAASL